MFGAIQPIGENRMKFADFIDRVDLAHDAATKRFQTLHLVANVRGQKSRQTKFEFNEADISEQFSQEEFSEIATNIERAGFHLGKNFYNELDLIDAIMCGQVKKTQTLIYNLVRNGHIYSRKCLMPAFLEFINFPYTCSNSLTVSLCRNKYYVMKLLQAHNIQVPKTFLYTSTEKLPSLEFNFPVIIKDIMGAASTGMTENSIVSTAYSLGDSLQRTHALMKEDLVVQEFVDGMECEVPVFVLGEDVIAMDPVGIAIGGNRHTNKKILTYECSYQYDYGFFPLHEEIEDSVCQEIKEIARKAAKLLRIRNYGRIDFRINNQNNPYIIDISTTPYTISHSSFAFAFNEQNLPYHKIYDCIIVNAYLNMEQDII